MNPGNFKVTLTQRLDSSWLVRSSPLVVITIKCLPSGDTLDVADGERVYGSLNVIISMESFTEKLCFVSGAGR
jgi:hypothetical protein